MALSDDKGVAMKFKLKRSGSRSLFIFFSVTGFAVASSAGVPDDGLDPTLSPPAAVPAAVMVRVPVDAQGQQISEGAELRVIDVPGKPEVLGEAPSEVLGDAPGGAVGRTSGEDSAPVVNDAEAAAEAFESATVPARIRESVVFDELDRDQSTESFWGWRRRHYGCHVGCSLDYRPVLYVGPAVYTYAQPVYFYTPVTTYQVVSTAVYNTTVVGYTFYYYPLSVSTYPLIY